MLILFKIYIKLQGLSLKIANSVIAWIIIFFVLKIESNFILNQLYNCLEITWLCASSLDLLIYILIVTVCMYFLMPLVKIQFKKVFKTKTSNKTYIKISSFIYLLLGINKWTYFVNICFLIYFNMYCIFYIICYYINFNINLYINLDVIHIIFLLGLVHIFINFFTISSFDIIRIYEKDNCLNKIYIPIKYKSPQIYYIAETAKAAATKLFTYVTGPKVPLKEVTVEVLQKELLTSNSHNLELTEKIKGSESEINELKNRLSSSHIQNALVAATLVVASGTLYIAYKTYQVDHATLLHTQAETSANNKELVESQAKAVAIEKKSQAKISSLEYRVLELEMKSKTAGVIISDANSKFTPKKFDKFL